ncbi:unnamed protein product [Linum trigynum]|uniref:Bidirectional sugar transporter SWEET n=1 Tax=Linum trigynum TaxID=586398 RepID=A0AAV2CN80_9ROSI
MVNAELARTVVGIIGNVISFGLFLSPVPTFWRICKKKDVEEFQPYPYIAAVMNCLVWVFYGTPVITPNSVLVVTINSIGLALELIYLSIFVFYDRHNKGRKKVFLGLLGEVLLFGVIIAVALAGFHTQHSRNITVGIVADVFNIIMYASPLAVMAKVYKTKSVEFMPLWLSVANFANGSIWTAYALIHGIDWFIVVSNGLGAIFAVVQLVFYAYFSTKYGGTSKPAEPKSEVQLSDVTTTV